MTGQKLSQGTKLAYGSGDLGTAISAALRGFFMLIFFTDVAGLSPAAAGSIVALNKIWDAFNDPIIGWLSDHTVTRWGRRRPWLLFGAIPFGTLFFLLWWVPPLGPTGKYVYYTVVLLLLDTFYTVVNVPYTALTAELTQDYDERTSLNNYRFAFSVGGALVSAFLHPIIVNQFGSPQLGYAISGFIWAIVSTIPCFVVFAAVRENPDVVTAAAEPDPIPYLQQIRIAFANHAYRYVIGIYLCAWLALQLAQNVLLYYLRYYMLIPDLIPWVLLAVQGTSFVFLFVWNWLGRTFRWEKRTVFIVGAGLWLVAQLMLSILTPSNGQWVFPIAALAGAGLAVAYLIPWSMVPDVIEFDEWETGRRREGIFYGFMVLLQKVAVALAVFLTGVALQWRGYLDPIQHPNPIQPESALQAIRFFIGPVPALFLALGIIIAFYYPITRKRHTDMLNALAERKQAAAMPEPITVAAPVPPLPEQV
jgi:GPH family glycoside/pentoside/hexuronide:cation symporter